MNVIIFAQDRCAWTLKTSKVPQKCLMWKMLKDVESQVASSEAQLKGFSFGCGPAHGDVLCAVNICDFFPIFPSFSRFLQVHWSSLLPHSSLFYSLQPVTASVSSPRKSCLRPCWSFLVCQAAVSCEFLRSCERTRSSMEAVALFQHQLDSVFGEVTFRAAGDWGISISSGEASVCSVFHQPVTLECALMKGVMFQAAPTWLPLPLAESERGAQGFNGT